MTVRAEKTTRTRSHRALSDGERTEVLDTLHSERFVNDSPAQVYAALLDEGTYLASQSTMYRVLVSPVGQKRPPVVGSKPATVDSKDMMVSAGVYGQAGG